MPTIEDKNFWEHQIEKLKASGQSRSQYCRENNINYNRLGYWLKNLLPVTLIPIKIQSEKPVASHPILCTIELRGHLLKIHDISALSILLERFA